MNLTQLEFLRAVMAEMEKTREDYQAYPESFETDCNSCWSRRRNPQQAAAELIVNYGWLDRPVKISPKKRYPSK
jgi:hypothetical protein